MVFVEFFLRQIVTPFTMFQAMLGLIEKYSTTLHSPHSYTHMYKHDGLVELMCAFNKNKEENHYNQRV